ncbi:hypothetical protein [Aliiroseovarius sp.]|uniref:hypothetical protein n=1 Tax=Aliiroseovarius sp. TaxID=1872442 RepID=UPI003BA9C343
MKRGLMAVLAGVMMTGAAMAEPVEERAARKMLFSPKGMMLEPIAVEGLSDDMTASIDGLVAQFADRKRLKALEAAGYSYYGALAVPTDQPLKMEHLAFVAKLHSPEAAKANALKTCAQTSGSRACAVVALLLPKSWKPQPLMLSQPATERLRKTWKEGDGPKALAISLGTEAWVIAKGPGAAETALERCNIKAVEQGGADCEIVVAEE